MNRFYSVDLFINIPAAILPKEYYIFGITVNRCIAAVLGLIVVVVVRSGAFSCASCSLSYCWVVNIRNYDGKSILIYQIQSTLVISNSKGLSETLRDIRTTTYQIFRIEEKIIRTTTFNKLICN